MKGKYCFNDNHACAMRGMEADHPNQTKTTDVADEATLVVEILDVVFGNDLDDVIEDGYDDAELTVKWLIEYANDQDISGGWPVLFWVEVDGKRYDTIFDEEDFAYADEDSEEVEMDLDTLSEAVELKVGDTVKWWDGGLASGHGKITKEYKIDGHWQVYDVEWNDGTTSEEITSANLRKVRLVPKYEPQYYQNQWRPTESVRKNRRAMHEAGESAAGYDKAKLGAALNAASRKITPARFFKMLKEAGMSDTDIYNFQEYLANEEQIFEEDYSEADLALHGSEWLTILDDYEGVEVDWDNCKDLDKEIEKYLWKYSEDNYQNRAKAITAEYCEGDIFYIYYLSQEGDSEEILEDIENMPFIEALVDAGYSPEVYVNDRDANHSVVIAHYKDGKWLDGDAGEEEVDNVDLVQKCWPNLRGENIDLIAGWYDEEGGEFDEDDFMDMLWASSYDDDEVVALQQDLIDCGYYEADEMPHDFTGEKVTLEDWCWDNRLDSVAAEQFKKYLDKVGVLGDKDMPPEEFEELYIKFQNAKVK